MGFGQWVAHLILGRNVPLLHGAVFCSGSEAAAISAGPPDTAIIRQLPCRGIDGRVGCGPGQGLPDDDVIDDRPR